MVKIKLFITFTKTLFKNKNCFIFFIFIHIVFPKAPKLCLSLIKILFIKPTNIKGQVNPLRIIKLNCFFTGPFFIQQCLILMYHRLCPNLLKWSCKLSFCKYWILLTKNRRLSFATYKNLPEKSLKNQKKFSDLDKSRFIIPR